MARPIKKGLGYFPLDTDILSDRKIRRLSQRFGCDGIATYLAILCEVYGTTGYYAPFTDDFCFDIGFTLGLREERVHEIVDFCQEIHLFDRDLFERKRILTSRGIQSRFLEVGKRGVSRDRIDWEVLGQSEGVIDAKTGVSVAETSVIVPETPENDAKTPTKGKGKGNKTTIVTKNQSKNENSISDDNGEAARRAELLQMAADATGLGGYA